MRNVKLDATISNLTVQQAVASFFRAKDNGNEERASKLSHFLRLAAKPLREMLDRVRSHKAHPPKHQTEAEAQRLDVQEAAILADLDAIKRVLEWRDPAPGSFGEALRQSGVRLAVGGGARA